MTKQTIRNTEYQRLGPEHHWKPGDWSDPRQHPMSLRWYARIVTNEHKSYGYRQRVVWGNTPEEVVKKVEALQEQFDLPKRKADAL